MKKGLILLIVLAAIAAIAFAWGVRLNNTFTTKDETVKKAWNNVEADYQRRADLIPNLVNVVKGYAKHESETLQEVVDARTKATQVTVDSKDLTPEKLAEYQKAQGEVSSALGKLIAITEAYPDLKANEEFLKLQDQLEGTENRIKKSRTDFNDAVQDYNTSVRKFPGSIVASLRHFDVKEGFKADEGASKAPTVEF